MSRGEPSRVADQTSVSRFTVDYQGDTVYRVAVEVPDEELDPLEAYSVTVTVTAVYDFHAGQRNPTSHELATCRDTDEDGFRIPAAQYTVSVQSPTGANPETEVQCLGRTPIDDEDRSRSHTFELSAPADDGTHPVRVALFLHRQSPTDPTALTLAAKGQTAPDVTVGVYEIEGRRSLRRLTEAADVSVQTLAREYGLDDDDPLSLRELLGVLVRASRGEPPTLTETHWSNWVGESDRPERFDYDDDRKLFEPTDLEELVSGMKYLVEVEGRQVRAVGSGHSHSNAPSPREYYIDIGKLEARTPGDLLPQPGLKRESRLDVDPEHLVRVPAGTMLKRLNRDVLAPSGLALDNMGSFDGQTLAGAVNTATHGTGIGLATLADMVQSAEMVTVTADGRGDPSVELVRIERSDGITRPDADLGQARLIQDDDVFDSAVAGFGCMGIAYAYTMRVRDAYWLREDSQLMQWNTLKGKLRTGPVRDLSDVPSLIRNHRHVQLLVNLPAVHNSSNPNPVCLVRTHDVTTTPDRPSNWNRRWPPERRKTPIRDLATTIGNRFHPLKDWSAWDLFGQGPDNWADRLSSQFFTPEANRDPFIKGRDRSASHIALRRIRDRGNYPPKPPERAISTDVAVPLHHLTDAVDEVLQVARGITQTHSVHPFWRRYNPLFGPYDKEFDVHFGVPMGIRFIAPSEQHLSAAYGRWSAMIETPFIVEGANANLMSGVPNVSDDYMREEIAKPALERIEDVLVNKYEGRPHLGKTNTVDKASLSRIFTEGGTSAFDGPGGWLETYNRFNAFGTFDNAFTDQLGISNYAGGSND